jgi:multiple sugar transport system substrate-binding protein
MWKKSLFLARILLFITILLLAACAPATTTAPTEAAEGEAADSGAAPAADGEKTKIRATVWVGQAELDALNQMTDTYLETHPDIEVEWINISGGGPYGRDKLLTMIAGGDIPDMMMLNTGQFEGLASRGALLPLDDFVSRDSMDLGIYWPQAIEGSKYQGTLYALPRDMSNVILYYNKDLFDAAGVAYPTDDWTWDDFLAAAQELTIDKDGDGQIDQWGFGLNNIVWVWAGFVWGNGGDVLSEDRKQCLLEDPKTVEALEFYFGLQTEEGVSPPPGALPEASGSGDQMLTQAIAMGLFGPWWRPAMVGNENQFAWDVANPPMAPGGGRGSVAYIDHWAMSAQTEVADETWEFMKFLTSQEGQEMWTELIGARSISPIKAVAESDAWTSYGGSSGQIILDALSFSQAPPVNFGNANEAENIWNQEFGLVIAGEKTVADAVASICSQIAPVLAESQ